MVEPAAGAITLVCQRPDTQAQEIAASSGLVVVAYAVTASRER